MAVLMSACGVVCSECGAYKAGRSQDPAERERIAAAWKRLFKMDIAPESLSCSGCMDTAGSALSLNKECWVRQCALAKGIAHCGVCDDYPCAELERAHAQYDGLDKMAETLSEQEFAEFVLPFCQLRERLASAVRRPWDWS